MEQPILSIRNLHTYFRTDDGIVKAVDNVTFDVFPGETLGIVGESGSGKTVTCLSAMNLVHQPPGYFPSGKVLFDGQDVLHMSRRQLESMRGDQASMIFQDPMTSLNPYLTVERQLTEVLEVHQHMTRATSRQRVIEMLGRVGIPNPEERIGQYPHQFSGGMRQRVMIAMALLCQPKLLIADEPTTALDVTIQAQILDLIQDLKHNFNTSVILITHDLGVVAGVTDRLIVMYAGKIVEQGPTEQVFAHPGHPYTQGLLKSVPRLDKQSCENLEAIPGLPPDLSNLPSGCPFHPRCSRAVDRCLSEFPDTVFFNQHHSAVCWELDEPLP